MKKNIFKTERITNKGTLEVSLYDIKGNQTYYKTSQGNEKWHKYDEQGNLIYSKDSDGEKMWYKITYYEDL